VILAPAEHRVGVRRTFTALLACQAVGLLLAAGLIKLAWLAREPWLSALTGETVVGALPGMLGVGFVLSCTLPPLWRRRLRLLLTVAVTISALYLGHLQQVAQACGAAVGLVGVALTYDRTRARRGLRTSAHEARVLASMLVAAPALGGMLVALAANAALRRCSPSCSLPRDPIRAISRPPVGPQGWPSSAAACASSSFTRTGPACQCLPHQRCSCC
jgi:phosphatidylglycerol lysyltransferase